MRIINGNRALGLKGIKRDSAIPECHGIHGVHESGALDEVTGHETHRSFARTGKLKDGSSHIMIETGGVRIYRPLLGFQKDRLRATCKEANMEWFEDHTNKDPTLTSRNAIRHMYSSHAVPTALTAPSILSLSEKFEARYQRLLKVVNSRFEHAFKVFEPRTGTISIEFPDLSDLDGSPSDMAVIAALLLQKVIGYVTPREHVDLKSLYASVSRVFPETSNGVPSLAPPAFTVSGVQFRPLEDRNWLISRQRYHSQVPDTLNIVIPPSPVPLRESTSAPWSPWSLFDGRFWLRIQNLSNAPIIIRPFHQKDLANFRESLAYKTRAKFQNLLKEIAPGDIRWTLPAIVIQEADEEERVLALPTLDVAVKGFQAFVTGQVRYKKVDMERLNAR